MREATREGRDERCPKYKSAGDDAGWSIYTARARWGPGEDAIPDLGCHHTRWGQQRVPDYIKKPPIPNFCVTNHSSFPYFLSPQEQKFSSDKCKILASFQHRNGVWWSDDRTRFNNGSGWVQNNSIGSTTTTAQQIPSAARYRSDQRGISPESHSLGCSGTQLESPEARPLGASLGCSGTQLDSPEARPLGATMSALFGHDSTTDQQQPQPPNGFFGTDRQTPGMPVIPQTSLNPAFRDAAKRDRLIAAFVSAHDKINR